METTEYLGFTIRRSNDPWMVKYNMPFEYFRDGERIRGAASLEDAKDLIDDELDQFQEKLNQKV